MERSSAGGVVWVTPELKSARRDALVQKLKQIQLHATATWGWVLLFENQHLGLVISFGKVKPHRTAWPTSRLPEAPCLVSEEEILEWSPFHSAVRDFEPLYVYPFPGGALLLSSARAPSSESLDEISLLVESVLSSRETASLRRKVQKLSAELRDRRKISKRLQPALERGERRAEALSNWYRQASEMLTSTQLKSRLPRLAKQAQQLLEVDVSIILVKETGRVRIWGGGGLEEKLTSSIVVENLGSLGKKVLEQGEIYRYQRTGRRRDRFLDSLGLISALVLPLEIEGRVLGAVLFGHRRLHRFSPDEIDLARLTAYQSALFLENTMLVTGSDVERVVARAVLESMADGVLTLDWEKKITSFNPAAELITGWRSEEAIGRPCSEVMQGRYFCKLSEQQGGCQENCPLLTLLADQALMDSGLTVEGTITNKRGDLRFVSSTYSVVADRGDLLGAVVLFRDITEKKLLEEMKSDYAAALSHDLKTPLTAMKGYALTLLKHGEKLDKEAQTEALEVINFEIDRVTRMFDNLLHQARLEAGVKNHVYSKVCPAEVIRQVVTLYAYSGRSHKLSCQVEPEDLSLVTDRDQLDQVLNNLVSNALKYTPEGGRVEVRCRREIESGTILFEVVDDGPGIPEEDLPYVFRRFHRLSGPSSRLVRGTGLGLHISRMLVESLGGQAGVTSKLGKGSTFWFRLPEIPPPDGDGELEPVASWYHEFLRR